MGLGGYPAVSLAKARQTAKAARDQVADCVNPIEARRKVADAAPALFGELAEKYIKDHAPVWKNP